jgi:hypothetical protein
MLFLSLVGTAPARRYRITVVAGETVCGDVNVRVEVLS